MYKFPNSFCSHVRRYVKACCDNFNLILFLSQETCLYHRLNAALRNQDKRGLQPFLPYMKLLLSGLYQLPLVHVRTYRGVKLELYKVIHICIRARI